MSRAIVSFCIIISCIVHITLGQCPWNAPGVVRWSSPSTWPNNIVPLYGNVTLPVGVSVVYDLTASANVFYGITVPATSKLIFDGTKNVTLVTNYVFVQSGGYFYIGNSNCSYPTLANITLVGPRDTVTSISGFGNKAIINGGTMEFYGVPPKPTWTRVANTVNVGSTSFTVQDDLTNWQPGNQIFIATTDYYQQLSEVFTIVSVVGRTITIDKPTQYLHWGANSEFAEVGILTRNILIQGDSSSDSSQFGGHVLSYRNTTIAKCYGVEFTRMGQRGILARYPYHYHYMGDQIGRGHYVNESSFHNNYQRCLTVHGTSGVAVQNNVGFNVTGHCYFLEEGSETWNYYNHNLGVWANPGPMIPTDAHPSIFWITNPNNTFINNTAVGGYFGFWFSLPAHPLGMSAGQTWIYPRLTPLLLFENNTAHSAQNNGVHCDNGPLADGTEVPDITYTPLVPPYTSTSADYNTPSIPFTIRNTVSYKNRNYGIWINADYATINNALLIDNGIGINMPGKANIIQNSVIIGQTDNIGTPAFTQFFDDQGRSRPQLWEANFKIHGFEEYDIKGSQFARNVTFINFTSDAVRDAGAVGFLPSGENVCPPTDILSQVTLINSNIYAQEPSSLIRDGPNHVVVNDADGSLTGVYGSYIVANNSILTYAANCTQRLDWTGFFQCQPHENGYSLIIVQNRDPTNTNFGNSLSYTYRGAYIPFGFPNVVDYITGTPNENTIHTLYQANVISRKGYVLLFPHPTPAKMQLDLRYGSTGEWVVVALQYPSNTTFTLTRGSSNVPMTSVNSLNALTATTFYFDSVGQYIYIMCFEDNGNLENSTGFPVYGYGTNSITLTASCGSSCNVPNNLPIPPVFASGEDSYRAKLTGCTAGTLSSYQGKAFINYNPYTKRMSYLIYHGIPQATMATLSNETGVFYVFPVPQSPLRGSFLISWDKHNDLWTGNWTITISSAISSQTIAGKLGCYGSCSAPPMISSSDPCATIPGSVVLYGDALNTSWSEYAWGATRTYNYSADARCGNNSIKAQLNSWAGWALATGACNPGACRWSWQVPYINVSAFSYLQFLVKSPNGPILGTQLSIRITNSNNTVIGPDQVINYNYIDNFFIENSWTRVKVPLSYLGLKGNELLGIFTILVNGDAGTGYYMLFDQIRLVPNYADPITKAPFGSMALYSEQC